MSVNMLANPTSTMMTGLVVPPPPFQKSRSAPGRGRKLWCIAAQNDLAERNIRELVVLCSKLGSTICWLIKCLRLVMNCKIKISQSFLLPVNILCYMAL